MSVQPPPGKGKGRSHRISPLNRFGHTEHGKDTLAASRELLMSGDKGPAVAPDDEIEIKYDPSRSSLTLLLLDPSLSPLASLPTPISLSMSSLSIYRVFDCCSDVSTVSLTVIVSVVLSVVVATVVVTVVVIYDLCVWL
ncbi:hypothetical protein ES703_125460 [subsurface metagenome]